MTKPALPPITNSVEVVEIEIDAMDGREWEQGQRTPQASDANLAALVKESASAPEPADAEGPRRTPLMARTRATGPASPQRARPPDAPKSSARRAASSTSDPGERATQVGPAGPVGRAATIGHLGAVAAPSLARTMGPPPASVARAGSPALDRAPSSTDFDASVPTLNNVMQGVAPSRAPTAAPASSTDVPRVAPSLASTRAPTGAPAGAPPSLNDILRAPVRPLPADLAAAPVVLPLPAPAETSRNSYPFAPRDLASSPPSEHHVVPDAGARLGSAAWRRLLLVIGGIAGCAVLVMALVVMTGGKSDDHPTPPAVEDQVSGPAVAATAAPVTPRVAGAPGASLRPPMTPATATALPAARVDSDPEPPAKRVSLALATEPTPSVAASQSGRRPGKKATARKVVVDYSTRSEEAMPGLVAQEAEDPAIGLARAAYLSGNQQLFSGDAAGAIRAYRESLALYPGYVGGYRGLGLAYAQLGDNQNALEAFKTYVDMAPGARDVALIRKRIARLQGK